MTTLAKLKAERAALVERIEDVRWRIGNLDDMLERRVDEQQALVRRRLRLDRSIRELEAQA